MPNWIEGTLKLRGKADDIRRFFNEGLGNNSCYTDVEEQVTDDSNEGCLDFAFNDEPYIRGTRRAFVTSDGLCVDVCDKAQDLTVCVNVKQAWGFICDKDDESAWRKISDEYNLDLKLYGIECGMEFTEEVIILKLKKPIINVRHYEDWMWECPFPNMGG